MANVVTRFAPSPTGYLHLGHAHAALFAEREAHLRKGTFLLRIEDIDHTPGACRICLVEIHQADKAAPQIVTACNTPVREGMDVQTRSNKVRDMQRLQVELLMADHLQDCATCIRHGSCELQDIAQFVGLRDNRFFDRARTEARPVDPTSPAMIRDMRRCVRCQRCVAICRYHQKVDALAIEGTGLDRMVALRDAKDYPSSACVSCGQCVLVCPTGALGERDETELALERTGKDVGTPILTFRPGSADEASFFGPVIARIPRGDAALKLWDAVETVATTSGMAELKRSLRERPSFD